jgi:site-specific recombinase XerD
MGKPTHNPQNERVKHQYFHYLREARRRNGASIDAVAKALSRFEESTGFRDFRRFHREQAVAFKRKFDEQLSQRTRARLSRATVHSTLSAIRGFFIWLADQPGFKSRISYSDADYFNLSEKDVRVANARRHQPGPALDEVHLVLAAMPGTSELELRDRAVISCILLTGVRDGALVSLKLKHISVNQGQLDQDAREVKTKFSKSFSTWFFPVGGDARQFLEDWVRYLREQLGWSGEDPLFPATRMGIGQQGLFVPVGLERAHWTTAEPVRRIFRTAFERAGLPYFAPHSVRKTLVQLGEQVCQSPEEFKAWSQNLGHEGVLTTLNSYGTVSPERQAEIIRSIRSSGDRTLPPSSEEILDRIAAMLPPRGASKTAKG